MENNDNIVSLSVSTEGGMQSFSEAVAQYNDVKEGYTENVDSLQLDNGSFASFIDDMGAKYTFKEYDYTITPKNRTRIYKGPEVKIYSNSTGKNTIFDVVGQSLDVTNSAFKIYQKYSKQEDEVKIHFHDYFMNQGRLQNKVRISDKKELAGISAGYYPYINTDLMFEQFLTNKENIMVLLGKPGIGKSKMCNLLLKYMVENPENLPYDKTDLYDTVELQHISVCYVKNEDVLADDMFWREVDSNNFDLIILDDLDHFLISRDADVTSQSDINKNKFLSQLLSYTDGITVNKTKFIITSNRESKDTDSAVLRKGRLFDILELRDLKYEEAESLWTDNNLDIEEFDDVFTDAHKDISPAELGSEISKRLLKNKENNTKSYLHEDGISIIKKAKRARVVGFGK